MKTILGILLMLPISSICSYAAIIVVREIGLYEIIVRLFIIAIALSLCVSFFYGLQLLGLL